MNTKVEVSSIRRVIAFGTLISLTLASAIGVNVALDAARNFSTNTIRAATPDMLAGRGNGGGSAPETSFASRGNCGGAPLTQSAERARAVDGAPVVQIAGRGGTDGSSLSIEILGGGNVGGASPAVQIAGRGSTADGASVA